MVVFHSCHSYVVSGIFWRCWPESMSFGNSTGCTGKPQPRVIYVLYYLLIHMIPLCSVVYACCIRANDIWLLLFVHREISCSYANVFIVQWLSKSQMPEGLSNNHEPSPILPQMCGKHHSKMGMVYGTGLNTLCTLRLVSWFMIDSG